MLHRRSVAQRLALLLSLLLLASPLTLLGPTPTVSAEEAVAIVDLKPPRRAETVSVRRGNQTVSFHPLQTVKLRDGQEAVAGRLIVGFHDRVTPAERADAHRQAGARGVLTAQVVGPLGRRAEVVNVSGVAALEDAIQAYQADPRVRFAEPDYIERAYGTPNDSLFNLQWNMAVLGMPTAWDYTHGAAAVQIAILDCGIYEIGSSAPNGFPGHPDINGKVVARRDFTGSPTGSDDYCDHGTHVAGIASAITNNAQGVAGVGWDSQLINGKVLDDSGSGSTTMITQGIYWATDNGAEIINMSLGSNAPCSTAFQDAINYAYARGVVVVAAAGNDNLSTPHRPASCANTLAVASTDSNDTKSSFSSWGAAWVDVAAPGGFDSLGNEILSTDFFGDYVYQAGTSMASPAVAGVAALLKATGKYSTPGEIVNRITNTALPVPGTGTFWQYGRVNPVAALAPCAPVDLPVAPSPGAGALNFYFAEGYTGVGFDEYLTLLNPNGLAAEVTISYFLADGTTPTALFAVNPNSRYTVNVHEPACGVGRGKAVSARVSSTNNVGIIAERPIYHFYNGASPTSTDGALVQGIDGGHNAMGVTALHTTWLFAEGYTGPGFDEYLTIMNPNPAAGTATITYYVENDPTNYQYNVPLAPNSRTTVNVHEPPSPANPAGLGRKTTGHSTRVVTTVPTVVERPMYFRYNGSVVNITGGHTVMGANAPNQTWLFAEGYTGAGFDQYFTIMNPNSTVAAVTITYFLSDGSTQDTAFDVAANSRFTVAVHSTTHGVGRDKAVSARVTTTNPGGIVVERPMYFNYNGVGIANVTGGHNVMGANATSGTWYFAEGYTGAGFNEFLTIMNPNSTVAAVTITYFLSDGSTQNTAFDVAANSRFTVAVHSTTHGVGPGQAVAARVTTTNPGGIVVERPMYFNYTGSGISNITGGHNVMGFRT